MGMGSARGRGAEGANAGRSPGTASPSPPRWLAGTWCRGPPPRATPGSWRARPPAGGGGGGHVSFIQLRDTAGEGSQRPVPRPPEPGCRSPALTASPDCAAPRSCGSPGAGSGCYADACGGGKRVIGGAHSTEPGVGQGQTVAQGGRWRLPRGQDDPSGPALDPRDKTTDQDQHRKSECLRPG